MNKTSYQVSEASIKRYWKMWENNRKQDDSKDPIDLFNEWSEEENFSWYAKWDAMRIIAKEDFVFLSDIITDYQHTKQKLNKISEAFEIINHIKQ